MCVFLCYDVVVVYGACVALDACFAAAQSLPYVCPILASERLPMIHVADLVRGMLAAMQADLSSSSSSSGDGSGGQRDNAMLPWGFALAGFSFSPAELFDEIRKYHPDFVVAFDPAANPNMAAFAALWPDALDPAEARTGLGFSARYSLVSTVQDILNAHIERATLK